jgi:ATP-dependent Lon protease
MGGRRAMPRTGHPIGGVARYKVVERTKHLNALASQEGGTTGTSDAIHRNKYDRVIEKHQLEKILGVVRWNGEKAREEKSGIIMDLRLRTRVRVAGGILPVEMIARPGTGRLRLTGRLGDVCVSPFRFQLCRRVDILFPVLGDQKEWRAG